MEVYNSCYMRPSTKQWFWNPLTDFVVSHVMKGPLYNPRQYKKQTSKKLYGYQAGI